MKNKNTRLVYTDDKNLKIYQSLPDKDFKEFFMTYLTYEIGDDVSKTISNPYLQTMFMAAYADKIKYNEEKWERKAKANRENGKKGGRPPKNNTELQPNTEFDTEAKISPNEPYLATNDIDVPQEGESLPEAKISPNEPYLATNDIDVPQEGESLPEAKIEAKEEEIIIDTDNTEEMGTYIRTISNFATAETRRIEHEEDRSMEHMMKCLSTFDINKAKHQVFKSKTIDENMKRVADCLDPLLVEFSKTERSKFYISIIEEVLKESQK